MSASKPFAIEHELIWEDPEVHVLRVPFAHLGLGHTNSYIVRSQGEALVIDPGAANPLAPRAYTRVARSIGVDLSSARFLCTHPHFDHVGLVKQLTQPGSHILMGQNAYYSNPWHDYTLRKALLRAVLMEEGVPPVARRGLAAIKYEVRMCDLPERTYDLLTTDQTVHVGTCQLRVIETPGHARGHICLYEPNARLLFCGDHVLETTTPNLELPFEGEDNLRDYLDGLAKVEALDCQLALPGHGKPISDLAGLCDTLRQHHAQRLSQMYEVIACNPGCNGFEAMVKMPWRRNGPFKKWERLPFALRVIMGSQTFAYLEYLVNTGEIVREEDRTGRHYTIA